MGATLKLSPKHGLNPTVSVCFWCGEDKNEIALLGHIGGAFGEDIEAERRMVLDYEPCPRCKARMESGFTVVEVTNTPNRVASVPIQSGAYPTGRFVVVRPESARRVFGVNSDVRRALLEDAIFRKIF